MNTRRLRQRHFLAAILTLIGALGVTAGCGGGGTGTSRYVGNYTGSFLDATNSIDGNITFQVGSDGTVSGSGKDSKTGQLDPFNGSIDNSGNLSVIVTLDTTPYTVRGTMAFDADSHLRGNLNEFYNATGENVGSVVVNLVKN
ncbi:MAG: hypothetical protein QM758_05805 [Armatimonas sp.]